MTLLNLVSTVLGFCNKFVIHSKKRALVSNTVRKWEKIEVAQPIWDYGTSHVTSALLIEKQYTEQLYAG